jgi:hypothetical protein
VHVAQDASQGTQLLLFAESVKKAPVQADVAIHVPFYIKINDLTFYSVRLLFILPNKSPCFANLITDPEVVQVLQLAAVPAVHVAQDASQGTQLLFFAESVKKAPVQAEVAIHVPKSSN